MDPMGFGTNVPPINRILKLPLTTDDTIYRYIIDISTIDIWYQRTSFD